MEDTSLLTRPRQTARCYGAVPVRAILYFVGGVVIAVSALSCSRSSRDGDLSEKRIERPESSTELPENLAGLVDSLYADAAADRAYAASCLRDLGSTALPVVPHLVDRLGDSSWRVRRQAAEALGEVGGTSAVGPLIEILSDRNGDWSVRAAAALSLGQLGESRAVAPLIAVLNDMNAHVRHRAVIALGRIGTPETTETLAEAARSDSDAAVRFSAAQALAESGSAPSSSNSP
jgi:HEAT repeat protein